MQITFLHTREEQVQLLNDWAAGAINGVKTISLPVTAPIAIEKEALFLVPEPLIFGQQYYFVTDLWQKYFANKHPETKVIGIGYHPEEDHNYLNLFDLPNTPASFIGKAMDADKNIIFRKGKGENIRYRLQKFFEGHGDQSVTDELDKVLRIMQIAHDELENHGEPYALIQQELFIPNALPAKWKLIQNRWSFYQAYFECTPFYGEIEQLWQLLQKLSPFFDENCEQESLFWGLDCIETLKLLKTGLSEIEKIYVG